MDRNRNNVCDHPNWPLPVMPWEQAYILGVDTISLKGVMENRHKTGTADLFVFTERVVLPIDNNYWLEILPGFVTDYASVPKKPRFMRFLLRHNTQDVRRASVTHDALYNWQPEYIGWHRANDIFKRIILEDGGSRTKANLMHFGVETKIGKGHWETDTLFDQENRKYCVIHDRNLEAINFEELDV